MPCHVLAIAAAGGRELVTPSKLRTVETSAGGEFPLGFRGQCLANPFGVGFSVAIGDMNDRMVIEPANRCCAARTDVASWRQT